MSSLARDDSEISALRALIAQLERRLAEETRAHAAALASSAASSAALLSSLGARVRAIGVVSSPFSSKRGAPRQGGLAPDARARLVLDAHAVPADALEGLAEHSHVFLVSLFHADDGGAPRPAGKVSPPGLCGGRTGVFSTRSPHRPNGLGLTLCRLRRVRTGARVLELSGCDLLDGTPVLDVKPWLPTDAPPQGEAWCAPAWVAGPLSQPPPLRVELSSAARAALRAAVEAGACGFYGGGGGGGGDDDGGGGAAAHLEDGGEVDACERALRQVLALDVRSVHHGRGTAATSHTTLLDAARARVRALAPPGCRSESVAGDARADAGVGAAGEASRSPYYELAFDTLRLQLEYEAAPAAGEDGGDDRMLCRVVSCRVAGKGNDGAEDAGGDEVGGKRLLFKVCG